MDGSTTASFRPCAVIPTYDNPDTIRKVVMAVRVHLPVVVVDDGSAEAGRRAVSELGHEGLAHVHHRAKNGGKGAAVRSGLRLAQQLGYTHALQIDADTLEIKARIPVSNKLERDGHASHHCNDCCVIGTSLYISMFSLTGNWKRGVYDGGLLEFDLERREVVGPVARDLWMPHSVDLIDGSLVVLDSLRGRYLKGNAQPVGVFPGFTRGLASDGVFTYLGQSRNRNYSSRLGVSSNISIDTSIIVFDEQTKVSRSLFLPSRLSEIHAIRVVPS